DQVRLRRFKNQIKIFSKAQEILKAQKIDPKKVSLKVLAPLIEYSSYEEEESLQDKWSSLTAYVLEDNADIVFQQNCISILNRISSEEAFTLEKLYRQFQTKRQQKIQRDLEYDKTHEIKRDIPRRYSLDYFIFDVTAISKDFKKDKEKLEFKISTLIALGLLKWETDVSVDATKYDTDPEDDRIDVDVTVYNNDNFIFTPLGIKFIEVCEKK
ncbi:MAG: Abi-alpha family protein, partial [Bacteriovorax sp.]